MLTSNHTALPSETVRSPCEAPWASPWRHLVSPIRSAKGVA